MPKWGSDPGIPRRLRRAARTTNREQTILITLDHHELLEGVGEDPGVQTCGLPDPVHRTPCASNHSIHRAVRSEGQVIQGSILGWK